MADSPEKKVVQGDHVDIPANVSANIAIKSDNIGRSLWANGGSVLVFLLAFSIVAAPIVLLVMLFRQAEASLIWVWITMAVISLLIAFLVAFGLVRSVLEAER